MKRLDLRKKNDRYLEAFLYGLLLAAFIFLPFIIFDSGYFVYCGDYNAQQIPFYMNAHDSILSGNIKWNWYTDLGANFIGSYSFYLAGSPFFYLTLLFPSAAVPYLLAPLLMLKFGCASLFSYCYIKRHVKNQDMALLGALLYAFSGFSTYNIFFNHFHEAIVFFPLLLLGLDLLMEENKKGIFAIFVFVNCFVNYFFFVGEVVFIILYFILRMMEGKWKLTKGKFFQIAFEALIGVGLSSILLVPSVLATLGNSRVESFVQGWDALIFNNNQVMGNVIKSFFFPPDMPSALAFTPNAYGKWSSVAAWLPVFSMTGAIAWILCKPKTWIKRILVIGIAMSLIPILNSAFTAFNFAYYARWFYMLTLMLSLATVKAMEDADVDYIRGIKWTAFITIALTLAIGFMPNGNDENGNQLFGIFSREYGQYSARFWLYCAIALFALVLTIRLIRIKDKDFKKFTQKALGYVLIFTFVFNCYYITVGKIGGGGGNSKDDYIPVAIQGAEKIDLPKEENYRIDTPKAFIQNLGMHWKQKNVYAFQSMVPTSVFDFYHSIGVTRDVASRAEIDRYAYRAMTSVRFAFSKDEENIDYLLRMGYSKYDEQNSFTVLENQNYIPMGFTYDEYISRSDYDKLDEKHREAVMLAALVVEDENVETVSKYLAPFNVSREDYVLYPTFAVLCDQRAEKVCDSFTTDNDGFKAEFTGKKPELVFFSVPYDDGWSVEINGQKSEILKTNVGFMAVECGTGKNDIRFIYETPGLKTGMLMSGGSLLIFLCYMGTIVYLKRKKGNTVSVSVSCGKSAEE